MARPLVAVVLTASLLGGIDVGLEVGVELEFITPEVGIELEVIAAKLVAFELVDGTDVVESVVLVVPVDMAVVLEEELRMWNELDHWKIDELDVSWILIPYAA
jgi:hypothetical protein